MGSDLDLHHLGILAVALFLVGKSAARADGLSLEARVADVAISALETKDHMSPLDKDMVKLAEGEQRMKEKALEKAQDELEKQRTTPRERFIRDTCRDNIMTCLKLGALLLVEYVLKE